MKWLDKIHFQLDDISECLSEAWKETKEKLDFIKTIVFTNSDLIYKSIEATKSAKNDILRGVTGVGLELETCKRLIDEHKNLFLSFYEGNSEDYRQLVNLLNDIEKKSSRIHDVQDTIVELYDKILKVAESNNASKKLREENERLKEQNQSLIEAIESLESSFALVTQGVYNQDNIEFAAVKTYREGWRYLCYNGRQITNFDGISQISLNWDSSDKFINMDISFMGE